MNRARLTSKIVTGAILARPTGRRARGRPRTRWRDHVSGLAGERLGIPPEELVEVAGEREGCLGLPAEDAAPATQVRYGHLGFVVTAAILLDLGCDFMLLLNC